MYLHIRNITTVNNNVPHRTYSLFKFCELYHLNDQDTRSILHKIMNCILSVETNLARLIFKIASFIFHEK